MLTAKLPLPPSVNHYWRTAVTKRGRRHVPHVYVSSQGRQYQDRVARILEGVPRLTGRVRLVVMVHANDNRRRDLDNILKCLLDSLTHAGLWSDDSQIDELAVVRGALARSGHVVVEAHSMGDPT